MKKKMLLFAGVAFVAMAAVTTVFYSQSKSLSSVLLQNVEALANDEVVHVDCPGGDSECAVIDAGSLTITFYKK